MHELKVVVFGRGYGESILVELENDEWLVVDCFNDPRTKEPAALTYLKEQGLEPNNVLKKIVITHFHQDHIAGMKRLIEEASSTAEIFMPQALSTLEAFQYYSELNVLHAYDDISGVAELCEIVNYLDKKDRDITKIKQDSIIHNGKDYQIAALAPSNYDCNETQNLFISNLTTEANKIPPSAFKKPTNHFCIVLNIQSKKTENSVLLGADLEISSNPKQGWTSAMNSKMAPNRKSIRVLKIPHHGSHTGYHEPTWKDYVVEDVVAILTTFERSDLPREMLINKYKSHTKNLLATTKPKTKLKNVMPPAAMKILQAQGTLNTVVSVTPLKQFGYIEASYSDSNVSYNLFLDAYEL